MLSIYNVATIHIFSLLCHILVCGDLRILSLLVHCTFAVIDIYEQFWLLYTVIIEL